ncbi:putative membrane protein [Clostridioides difficile CD160]|nr:putative membrane protein [Clostridioides difficile CD160]
MKDLDLNAYFFVSFSMVLIIMILLYIKASNDAILSLCQSVSKRNNFSANKFIEFIFLHYCAFIPIALMVTIQYLELVNSVIAQSLILILLSFVMKIIYTFIIKKSIINDNLLSDKEMSITVCLANLSLIFLSRIYYVPYEFTSLIIAMFLGRYIALDTAFNFNIKELKKTFKEDILKKEFIVFVILDIVFMYILYIIGIENFVKVVFGSMIAAIIFTIIFFIVEKLKTKASNV